MGLPYGETVVATKEEIVRLTDTVVLQKDHRSREVIGTGERSDGLY